MRRLLNAVFSRENLLAFLLALVLMLILIFSLDTPATWIYQGF